MIDIVHLVIITHIELYKKLVLGNPAIDDKVHKNTPCMNVKGVQQFGHLLESPPRI